MVCSLYVLSGCSIDGVFFVCSVRVFNRWGVLCMFCLGVQKDSEKRLMADSIKILLLYQRREI